MTRISLIFVLLSCLALFCPVNAPDAHAGVLIDSSRVTSGFGNRKPRAHLSRARKSTYAASRTMPSLGKSSVWGVESEVKLIEQREKYLKRLHKWEQKRLRKEQKELRKRQKEQEKLEKKLKKERAALLKKQKKLGKVEIKNENDGKDIELSKGEGLKTGADKDSKGKSRKPSFWARLKHALFGR